MLVKWTRQHSPLTHEKHAFVGKDSERAETRESKQREDEQEQAQPVLKTGNVVCDVVEEEAAEEGDDDRHGVVRGHEQGVPTTVRISVRCFPFGARGCRDYMTCQLTGRDS